MTAGESHGEALTGLIEGIPAGVQITSAGVSEALARRRLGYGRGARMKFEQDVVSLLAGVRHGLTMGSPVVIQVANTEWPKWQVAMSPDPVPDHELDGLARAERLHRPRPGHADLAGMSKYASDDIRPILERASARETAARVAVGYCAATFLRQVAGIEVLSHVVELGSCRVPDDVPRPRYSQRAAIDDDPLRCAHAPTSEAMVAHVDQLRKAGDTLGGVVEVVAENVPPGLGSHIQWDRRLDARLAGALMSIQAIKGVEIGAGFECARRPGSATHDQLGPTPGGGFARESNNAGGLEGGMSNGEAIVARVAMKPISTVPRALSTIDTDTGQEAVAINQRSDVCAVPAAGVVSEAMMALVLAEAVLEKFGGDHVSETARNLENYLAALPDAMRPKGNV